MVALLCVTLAVGSQAASISDLFSSWQPQYVNYWNYGNGVTLTLTEAGGAAGLGSNDGWLFGSFGIWLQLPSNAPGVVATFYMSSTDEPNQCEFDFEFLGNVTGQPIKIHTNVFVNGVGGREEQIYPPGGFDPTADYHYYSFEWHQDMVVFYVDYQPIRQFRNLENIIPNFQYCNQKPMHMYLSIWDGSQWATEGGAIPINWSLAPFQVNYDNLYINGCTVDSWNASSSSACTYAPQATGPGLTPAQVSYLENDIKNNPSICKYDYCTDYARYPPGTMPECNYNAM